MTTDHVIVGRYRLERRLGLGGMSTVHLAIDQRLERPVAVKLLAEHLADDPTFVSRFQREALSAARLVHPNVVQVFDSGLDPETAQHFIVMEYVPGESLAELLRERGQLGVEETIALVTQACHGLDYAHRQGVVHRDVKPGNLLRTPEGVVKLADFGIARAANQSSITQVGSVLGTAAYLAPEQAAGEEVDARCDLYSLGVVVYQALAGRLPYEAASLSELVLKQQRESPAPLHEANPDVPPSLSQAVAVALSIDQRHRYDSAEVMGEALEDGARGIAPDPTAATSVLSPRTEATAHVAPAPAARTPVAPREPVAARRVRRPAPAPAPARARPPARRSSGRARRVLAVVLILALVGGAIAIAVLSSMDDSQRVELRDIAYDSVNGAIDDLKGLIEDNTR